MSSDRERIRFTYQQWTSILISVLLSAILLAFDSLWSHGTIPAIGYSLVILLALQLPHRYVYVFAGICTVLTWLGFLLEPAGRPLWISLIDRIMITGVVWTTAVLGLRLTQAQRELTIKAKELQRSNNELENFAGLVSHDLRSPLLTILHTMEIALEQSGSGLDPEIRDMLEMGRDSAHELNHMITRLLEYSRAGHSPLHVGTCNCEAVVRSVLQRLGAVLEETDAKVTRDPLPVVRADSTLLSQLFQNLIENAAKYHGPRPPQIHISAETAHGEYIFSVRDNGTGFPENEKDRIFQRFIRGTHEKSKKGSGIGLATCQTIVERHHGRIWVASQPQEGSTFYFSLPVLPE